MLKLVDFAYTSLHVYGSKSDNARYIGNKVFPGAVTDKDFDPHVRPVDALYEVVLDSNIQKNPHHGFYASLYIKIENRKAVGAIMAIRGTVPSKFSNLWVDAKTWWPSIFNDDAELKVPVGFQQLAHHFMHKVSHYCSNTLKLTHQQIFVTGHSLGGALASLLVCFCDFNTRAITFNAPGVRDMIGVDKPTWNRILNIRSRYDFVSAIDYPIGPVMAYDVPKKESEAKNAFNIEHEHEVEPLSRLDLIHDLIETVDFAESALPQHSMANLLNSMLHGKNYNSPYNFIDNQMRHAYAKRMHYKLVSPFTKRENEEYVNYEQHE